MTKKITLDIDEKNFDTLESICSNIGKSVDQVVQELIVESVKQQNEFAQYQAELEEILHELESDPSNEAKAIFTITHWDEQPFAESGHRGPKLTKVKTVKEYRGAMQGTGELEYLMIYESSNTARFYGFERFTGSIDGKSGECIFKHDGFFENGVVDACWEVVSYSGTAQLENLEGEVYFSSDHAQEYPICLGYSFEEETQSGEDKTLADIAAMRDKKSVERVKHEDAWE